MNYIAVASENTDRKDINDAQRCAFSVKKALKSRGIRADILSIDPSFFDDDAGKLRSWLRSERPDVIFNLFEGFSEDVFREITFVKILEEHGVRYTGNPGSTLGVCLDKSVSKSILQDSGIPVPRGIIIKKTGDLESMDQDLPLFIKPVSEDASVGIDGRSLCSSQKELTEAVSEKLRIHEKGLLIEEFLEGDEFNVAFTGEHPYEVMAVSRLEYECYPECLPYISYESKWNEDCLDYKQLVFRVLPDDSPLKEKVIDIGRRAGKVLNCKSYFRVDLREREGKLYVLEVNPNPDINEDAGFARQAESAGHSYPELIEKIFMGALNGKNG